MAMSLPRAMRPLTGALHSLVPAAGARRTAGARRMLTLARRVAAPTPLRTNARRTLALARPTEDADSVQFPREGPGLDYALNWSLCGDGVVPSKLAYRITKVQTAEQLLAARRRRGRRRAGRRGRRRRVRRRVRRGGDGPRGSHAVRCRGGARHTDAGRRISGDPPGGDGHGALPERMRRRRRRSCPSAYVAPSCADSRRRCEDSASRSSSAARTRRPHPAPPAAAPAMLEAATAPVEEVDEAA